MMKSQNFIVIPLGINLTIFLFEKIKQINDEKHTTVEPHEDGAESCTESYASCTSVSSWINIGDFSVSPQKLTPRETTLKTT